MSYLFGLKKEGIPVDRWFEYLFVLYAVASPFSISVTNVFLGLIILLSPALLYLKGGNQHRLNVKVILSYCLLFSWGVVTALLSGSFTVREAFADIWEYSPMLVFPLILSISHIKKERIVISLFISSSVVCLLSLFQFFIPSISYPIHRQLVGEDSIRGFFSHHLHTGGFYSIIAILALALILFWQCRSRMRFYLWGAFILNISVILLSMARSYYISASIVILALLFMKNWRWFIFGIIGFIFTFILIISFPNSVNTRFKTLAEPDHPSNKERVFVWKAAIEMFKDHPLTGVGKGNWDVEAKEHYYPRFEKEWHFTDAAYAHAHNTYLTYLAEMGIIGLFLFLYFWGTVMWTLYGRILSVKTGFFDHALVKGSLGGLGNMFIAGLFENNFGTSVVLLLIALLIGLSLENNHLKTGPLENLP